MGSELTRGSDWEDVKCAIVAAITRCAGRSFGDGADASTSTKRRGHVSPSTTANKPVRRTWARRGGHTVLHPLGAHVAWVAVIHKAKTSQPPHPDPPPPRCPAVSLSDKINRPTGEPNQRRPIYGLTECRVKIRAKIGRTSGKLGYREFGYCHHHCDGRCHCTTGAMHAATERWRRRKLTANRHRAGPGSTSGPGPGLSWPWVPARVSTRSRPRARYGCVVVRTPGRRSVSTSLSLLGV